MGTPMYATMHDQVVLLIKLCVQAEGSLVVSMNSRQELQFPMARPGAPPRNFVSCIEDILFPQFID